MNRNDLNFTGICRCCKRTESGMTSIFDVNTDPTPPYPPVKEMLRSIASLNVQENDGLPSCVCPLCLNNIRDTFTFILQITLIDSELQQILLASEKQADTLAQDTYDPYNANQSSISTESESVEPRNEVLENFHDSEDVNPVNPVNHSLTVVKVEDLDLDEPVQIFYQHWSADHTYARIDFVVKPEFVSVPEIEDDYAPSLETLKSIKSEHSLNEIITEEEVPLNHHIHQKYESNFLTAAINDNYKNLLHAHAATDVKKEAFPVTTLEELEKVKEYNTYTVNDNNDLLQVQKTEDMDFDDEHEVEIDEICPKSRTTQRETTSQLTMFRCKLCAFTNARMDKLKRHLETHCKDKPLFACSKCNLTFARRDSLVFHRRRNCKGQISKKCKNACRRNASKQVASMTLQDLEDPLERRKYYTVTLIDVQNNEDIVKVQRPKGRDHNIDLDTEEICAKSRTSRRKGTSKVTVFKCNLCTFSHVHMYHLKQHLQIHSKDKLYTCSKCNGTFTIRSNMLCHRRSCNGVVSKYARFKRRASNHVIAMTQQDLKNPLKMKKYYTVAEIDVQDNQDDDDDGDDD